MELAGWLVSFNHSGMLGIGAEAQRIFNLVTRVSREVSFTLRPVYIQIKFNLQR